MSAPAIAVQVPRGAAGSPTRDPLPARLFSFALAGLLVLFLALSWDSLSATIRSDWPSLLFWALLVLAVDLLPVRVGHLRLTLDMPLLLSLALIFPPGVAGLVSFIAAFDLLELRGQVSLARALFNRAQIAVSIWGAGMVFHAMSSDIATLQIAIPATVLALGVDFLINVGLVSIHQWLLGQNSFRRTVRAMLLGEHPQFILVYLGYGVLALLLAHLFVGVGPWALLAFLIPIVVARHALVKIRAYREAAENLADRELLLQSMLERMEDERRDERLRIAGELHDQVLQTLIEIRMMSVSVHRMTTGPIRRDLKSLLGAATSAAEQLREVIHDLRTSPIGRGGLLSALTSLVQDIKLDWRVRVEVDLPTGLRSAGPVQLVAYQVIREALCNFAMHSGVTEARLVLTEQDDLLVVEVSDQGVGFDLVSVDRTNHFGLSLLGERVARIGGTFLLESGLGRGTKLLATLPVRPRGVSSWVSPTPSSVRHQPRRESSAN